MMFEFNPVPKKTKSNRIKLTQKQLGEISNKTRKEVKLRSNDVCEICNSSIAYEMAHLISRKQIKHKTTAADLLHVCVECHQWLDGTPEGIKWKRERVQHFDI